MNLLEVIAEALAHPDDWLERLQDMGVDEVIIGEVAKLLTIERNPIQVEHNGRWTTLAYRNDL